MTWHMITKGQCQFCQSQTTPWEAAHSLVCLAKISYNTKCYEVGREPSQRVHRFQSESSGPARSGSVVARLDLGFATLLHQHCTFILCSLTHILTDFFFLKVPQTSISTGKIVSCTWF